jgi:uncharacterized protein (TIGR01777 family)
MPGFVSSVYLPAPPKEAYAWHARPGALHRLIAPWDGTRLLQSPPSIEDGARTVLSVRAGPLRRRWVAEFHDCQVDQLFADRQRRGPFASWDHVHRFRAEHDGCRLEDAIEYQLPWGLRRLGEERVRKRLERLFAWRHQRTLRDLARHHAFRDRASLRVAIGGASGLVGAELSAFLASGGHTVLPLVRPGARGVGIAWDPVRGEIDDEALSQCDAVVHLGGHGIARRWSARQRRLIRDSRVESTRLLAEAIARVEPRPSVLVVASAIGWYGDRGDELIDEDSAPGDGFLAEVCRDWEEACQPAHEAGVRVINLRIGMVLSAHGGALPRLAAPFRVGLGGPVGSGAQWVSWIALDDLVYLIHHALCSPTLEGPVNAVAPTPVRNRDLGDHLGRVLRARSTVRTPAWAIRGVLGEMGRELILSGCRVVSRQLEQEVFAFSCPDVEQALRWEFGMPVPPRPAAPTSAPLG